MTKIDLEMLGPCGIYCETCDIRVAGKTGDVEAQTKIAKWIEDNCNTECRPEQIHCCGCRGPVDGDQHWSADCTVLKCARAREVTTCAHCGEFAECTTLEGFYRGGDYESARATLLRIREVGLEEWVREKEAAPVVKES